MKCQICDHEANPSEFYVLTGASFNRRAEVDGDIQNQSVPAYGCPECKSVFIP